MINGYNDLELIGVTYKGLRQKLIINSSDTKLIIKSEKFAFELGTNIGVKERN